ncbi:MAG: hypothetical protein KF726_17460, partial [Anaerolineae bacterium]|nr:hypothetical protein [Anaerolineae bacterium]
MSDADQHANPDEANVSRRKFIGLGLGAAATVASAGLFQRVTSAQSAAVGDASSPHGQMQMPTDGNGPKPQEGPYGDGGMHGGHGTEMLVGRVDHARNGFDPMQMLVD